MMEEEGMKERMKKEEGRTRCFYLHKQKSQLPEERISTRVQTDFFNFAKKKEKITNCLTSLPLKESDEKEKRFDAKNKLFQSNKHIFALFKKRTEQQLLFLLPPPAHHTFVLRTQREREREREKDVVDARSRNKIRQSTKASFVNYQKVSTYPSSK